MNLDPMIEATAGIFGVSKVLLIGAGRCRKLAIPRFAFYHVTREAFGLSLPVIGRAMGGRDHTSVLHGLRRAEGLLTLDQDFAGKVTALRDAATAHLEAQQADAVLVKSRLLKRTQRHVLRSLERLAIENPAGFDRLITEAGAYDPTHHF